jgi:hypothetical protein
MSEGLCQLADNRPKESNLALKGRRPGDAGRRGAGAVPAGAASSALHSGGPGIMPAGITTGARGASLQVGTVSAA